MAIRPDSQLPVLGRILWMALGPALVALCIVSIVNARDPTWLTVADVLFWLTLAAMIFGRWLEFQGGTPRTATYEPATPAHLRRYAIVTLAVGAAVWIGVNLFFA